MKKLVLVALLLLPFAVDAGTPVRLTDAEVVVLKGNDVASIDSILAPMQVRVKMLEARRALAVKTVDAVLAAHGIAPGTKFDVDGTTLTTK